MLLKEPPFKSTGHVAGLCHQQRTVKPSLTSAQPSVQERQNKQFSPKPDIIPKQTLSCLRDKLKKAPCLLEVRSDNTLRKVPGQTMGNKHYAWRQEARITQAVNFLLSQRTRTTGTFLWVTLTQPYEKTEEGRKTSWRASQKRLQPFLRAMRKIGIEHYITVKEAHRCGGCHIHVAMIFPGQKLPTRKSWDKRRLTGERGAQIRYAIKAAWPHGHVDVQVARNDSAALYLVKELGKAGHIEDALRRAERRWKREGDGIHKDHDIKKLWAIYYASTEHVRRVTMSQSIKAAANIPDEDEDDPDTDADLITQSFNSTEENPKPQIIRVIPLPWEVRKQSWYQPFSGLVEPGSEEDQNLRSLYDIYT